MAIADGDAPTRLYLLDGHSLAYRAFFALPTSLATSTGQVTNAVYGFTSMLIKLLTEERPELIAVAFDMGPPTVRLAMDSQYKAGRPETPSEFRSQLGLIEEVLAALKIPVIRMQGDEADDAIGTLAVRAAARGIQAVIVTADRDFFQLVEPNIRVMFNRKGISDIVLYDAEGVEARYGVPPAKYLDYVALKGDTSDNIPGVPGVGEKTAAKLVSEYGSVEGLLDHVEDLKGRLRESVASSAGRLALNKDLARIVTDLELPVEPQDCVMGDWDQEQVQRLFLSLEFRSLFDRLQEVARGDKPKVEIAELDLLQVSPSQLARTLSAKGPFSIRLMTDGGRVAGVAASAGGAQASFAAMDGLAEVAAAFADTKVKKWAHDSKALQRVASRSGFPVTQVEFDTLLAAYLLDPAAADYDLSELCIRHLGSDVLGEEDAGSKGQLFSPEPWRAVAAEAAAISLLAPVLAEQIDSQSLQSLLADVELPLASVLARMEARGIALDVAYLEEMGASVRKRMSALRAEVFQHAGEEFNLNSPPQLRKILYEKMGLQPGRKTPKGELSTDASVLEKLRDDNPIVDALLSWRELDKLNSTYLEALPRLVDPADGRIHSTFNQTVAATGRLSSSDPNLQNIPVRSELGRQIRRAFVAGPGKVLLVADYSQIELRVLAHLSGDPGLREAFEQGQDIHAATAAKVFGLPLDQVDPELRRRAKAVNYGLAYGMNAWGLATRLDIPPDQAQEIMEGYFSGFPGIKSYLDAQVARATAEGFTETLLGRRRYIPELRSSNPRVRDLGRRQALNAPIQGSASDVFKMAMIQVDQAIRQDPGSGCSMLLTVHDELVFEVDESQIEAAATLVRDRMEHAVALDVPLQADLGWGLNWSEAAPAGH